MGQVQGFPNSITDVLMMNETILNVCTYSCQTEIKFSFLASFFCLMNIIVGLQLQITMRLSSTAKKHWDDK